MDRVYDSFWGSRRGMQTAQYWSSNQYSNESRYQYRDATANGVGFVLRWSIAGLADHH